MPAITDTKELLERIAALRSRLTTSEETAAADALQEMRDQVQRGAMHHALLDSTLRSADPGAPAPSAPSLLRMTSRGARLLRLGKDLLQALRAIAEDPAYPPDDNSHTLEEWHREATAMLDVVLRTVQTMPASIGAQLRTCDGLEIVLHEIEERIQRLHRALGQQKRTAARINELAEFLRLLAANRPVGLTLLQALADAIIGEAKAGQPLRFLHASPVDPSRYASAHGLTVAQILARTLLDDSEWQGQLQLAVMAALVHDVGMTRVPAEVLLNEGPLSDEQRRLIEKHAAASEEMLAPLWPGGGWPIEAAVAHHERNDGTGYPQGQHQIHLHALVRRIAVCDVYAALCCPRPHRPAFDTRTALTETLLLAERGYLDQNAAERLLLLSFFPVGSAVELADGARGIVIATHPGSDGITHPDRPIVFLGADASGEPLAWPMIVDLLQHKERSILRTLPPNDRHALLGKRYAPVL